MPEGRPLIGASEAREDTGLDDVELRRPLCQGQREILLPLANCKSFDRPRRCCVALRARADGRLPT
jgi:hypothetical protein